MLERRIVTIIGKSGFGKTYLMRTLLASMPRAIILDQRGEYEGTQFYDFNQLADYTNSRPTFRAVWLGGQDYADAIFHLAFVLGDLSIILEEADLIECQGWYREAIYRGRMPYRLSLYALAQRPHLLSPDIRSQLTDLYCFNSSEPSALNWLRVPLGDYLDQIPSLAPKHGLHYSLTDTGPQIEAFRLP